MKREFAPREWADMNDYADAESDLIAEIMGWADEWVDVSERGL